MILANVRERFTATDIELVTELLARGDVGHKAQLTRVAQERGLGALLDAPDLPVLLRQAPRLGQPSPALFVYVVVRHALRRVGVSSERLSDYLGALVLEFGLRDRAYRISHADDEIYRYLTDIVAHAASASGRRGFLLRAHLGNLSLWLAGLYPDHITAREERRGGPGLRYYEELGAQGYRLASDHRVARELDMSDIYEAAAASFRPIRIALNRLSDRMLFPHVSTPGRLMRQVADEFGQ
ncbi:MAG: hypothetical protein JSW43_12040 [Gemmatimonadota bacterium]|nr:MAG: hypothetical protein JSW43_12040 [Gemmatimonadota bacterium]